MPHLDLQPGYLLRLSNDEFRLVTMALAGLLKDNLDVASALKLNEHLLHQRSKHLDDWKENSNRVRDQARVLRQQHEKSAFINQQLDNS